MIQFNSNIIVKRRIPHFQSTISLTHLGLQSGCGDKTLRIIPKYSVLDSAGLRGLKPGRRIRSRSKPAYHYSSKLQTYLDSQYMNHSILPARAYAYTIKLILNSEQARYPCSGQSTQNQYNVYIHV